MKQLTLFLAYERSLLRMKLAKDRIQYSDAAVADYIVRARQHAKFRQRLIEGMGGELKDHPYIHYDIA